MPVAYNDELKRTAGELIETLRKQGNPGVIVWFYGFENYYLDWYKQFKAEIEPILFSRCQKGEIYALQNTMDCDYYR
jgi:hypothetical protein